MPILVSLCVFVFKLGASVRQAYGVKTIYTVFHKIRTPFCFFIIHSNDDQFTKKIVPVVGEEILIQNIATKYGS